MPRASDDQPRTARRNQVFYSRRGRLAIRGSTVLGKVRAAYLLGAEDERTVKPQTGRGSHRQIQPPGETTAEGTPQRAPPDYRRGFEFRVTSRVSWGALGIVVLVGPNADRSAATRAATSGWNRSCQSDCW